MIPLPHPRTAVFGALGLGSVVAALACLEERAALTVEANVDRAIEGGAEGAPAPSNASSASARLKRPPTDFARLTCALPWRDDYYFPAGLFARIGADAGVVGHHDDSAGPFASFLRSMKEPSLSCESTTIAFRVLVQSRAPALAVRVENDGRNRTALAMQLWELHPRIAHQLSQDEWTEVTDSFRRIGFWQAPPHAKEGFDGETWLLEAREPGRYHAIARDTPGPGAFVEFCELVVRLAGANGTKRR